METLLSKVAETIIGILIEVLAQCPKSFSIHEKLRGDSSEKIALQRALASTYVAFSEQYPALVTSLFDEHFLQKSEVTAELAKILIPNQHPNQSVFEELWRAHFQHKPDVDLFQPLAHFLDTLENEVKAQAILDAFIGSLAFEQLHIVLEKLQEAQSPEDKAALIAETVIADLPLSTATTARRCVALHWFTPAIIEALLPGGERLEVEEVVAAIIGLPFVETIPWGYTYHELTRQGLIARYRNERAQEIVNACEAALPALLDRWEDDQAALEAFYCLVIVGHAEDALKRLDALLMRFGEREDWEHFGAVFEMLAEAEAMPFVVPLTRAARHWLAQGIVYYDQGELEWAIAAYSQAIALNPEYATAFYYRGLAYAKQEKWELAISDYDKFLALSSERPDEATAHLSSVGTPPISIAWLSEA